MTTRPANRPADEIRHTTGIRALDAVLGEGRGGTLGYPRGRVVELFGPPGAGKRTIALHAIAACQRAGGVAAYLDASHSLDVGYARACGVDPAKLLVSQPDTPQQLLEIAETLARSGAVDLIVVDDAAQLRPESGPEDIDPWPRMLSALLRRSIDAIRRAGATILFVTQLRPIARPAEGAPLMPFDTGTSGNALKYYASIRLDVRALWRLGEASAPGQMVEVKVVKNKLAPPFRSCRFETLDDHGVVERDVNPEAPPTSETPC